MPQQLASSLSQLHSHSSSLSQHLSTMDLKLSHKEQDPGYNLTYVELQLSHLSNFTRQMHGLEDHLWDFTGPKLAEKVDKGLDYQLATKEYLQEGVGTRQLELVLKETEALDKKVRREEKYMWVYSLLGTVGDS